jgi:predicted ATPase
MGLRVELFGSRIRLRWKGRLVELSRAKALFLGLTIKEHCADLCFDEWDWVAGDLADFYVTSKNPSAYIRQLRKETAESLCSLMERPYLPLETLLASEGVALQTDVAEFCAQIQSDDPHAIRHALMLYDDKLLEECREQFSADVPVPYIVRRVEELRRDYAQRFADGLLELWSIAPDMASEVGKAKKHLIAACAALSDEEKSELLLKSDAHEAFQRTREKMNRVLKLQRLSSFPAGNAGSERIFGRADVLDTVGKALADQRFVTLHGTGGVGKTTVMMEAAHRAAHRYPGGVCLLDISPLRQFEMQAEQNAECLSAWLHSQEMLQASHPLLLLIDNGEQEIEATLFLIEMLWRDFSHVDFLAATRIVRAHDEWGQIIPIEPFALPDLHETPASLLRTDALRLFLHHRKQAGCLKEPAESEIGVAAQICIQAAGIPLALRLLARTPGQKTLYDLQEHVRQFWQRQNSASDAHQDRQKTMYNCVSSSYALLSPEEQTLFRRLSVFIGGFTREVMRAVCTEDSQDNSYSLLSGLIGSGLVQDKEANRPYSLLEPIRTVAEGLLRESGEFDEITQRYEQWLDHQAEWVENQDGDITLFGSEAALHQGWQVYLNEKSRIEHIIHSLRIKEDFRAARLELRYVGLIWLEGRIHAGLNRLQFVDRFVGKLARDKDKMAYFLAKAVLTFAQSEDDYTQTIEYAECALRAAREAHDLKFTAFAMCGLGLAQAFEKQPEAENNIRNGLEIALASGDEWAIALAYMNMGAWHWHDGRQDEAIVHYQQSLERFRRQNHRIMIILVLNSLAHLLCRRKNAVDVRLAVSHYLESMKLASERRHLPNNRGLAGSILGASGVASACGDYQSAIRFYAAGRKAYQTVGAGILPPIKRDYLAEMSVAAQHVSDAEYQQLVREGEKRKFREAIREAHEYLEKVAENPSAL